MAAKKETVTSLKRDVKALTEQVEKLTKDLKQAQDSRDFYNKQEKEKSNELESLHSLLDVLPGALQRKTVPDAEQSWNVVQHSLMTRFAAYLAQRNA